MDVCFAYGVLLLPAIFSFFVEKPVTKKAIPKRNTAQRKLSGQAVLGGSIVGLLCKEGCTFMNQTIHIFFTLLYLLVSILPCRRGFHSCNQLIKSTYVKPLRIKAP
jgi:hypothetical protein